MILQMLILSCFFFPKRPLSPLSLLCLKMLTGAVIAAPTAGVSTGGHREKALGSIVKLVYFTRGSQNG